MLEVCIFFLLCWMRVFSEQFCGLWSLRHIAAYDDKAIGQSRIWTLNNTDIFTCAHNCIAEKYCVSLHYSTADYTCIALRGRFDGVSVVTVNAPGYLLYQTSKAVSIPYSDCAVDEDCVSLPNSHCEDGFCVCDFGYASNQTVCVVSACTQVSIPNHSFETEDDWADYSGGWTSDSVEVQDGGKSAKVTDGGAVITFLFPKPVRKLTLSGYSKNVGGPSSMNPPSDYSLYCDLKTATGADLWAKNKPFTAGESNWHKVTLNIDVPESDAFVEARCHVLYRNAGQGVAYFDNMFASVLSDDVTDFSQCS